MAVIKFLNGTLVEGTPQEIAEILRAAVPATAQVSMPGTGPTKPGESEQKPRCDYCRNNVNVFPGKGWGYCVTCHRHWQSPDWPLCQDK